MTVVMNVVVNAEATLKLLAGDMQNIKAALEVRDDRIKELETKIAAYDDALAKIHDLAGQLGRSVDHPHIGAIQAWVHEVSPCPKRRCESRWTGEQCVKDADHKGRHRGEEESEWA